MGGHKASWGVCVVAPSRELNPIKVADAHLRRSVRGESSARHSFLAGRHVLHADVDVPPVIDPNIRRLNYVWPYGHKHPVGREDLNPIVVPIADEDAAVRMDRHAMGTHELAWTASGVPPRVKETAVTRET